MKKVGILFGMEDTFPWAFIDRVNQLGNGEVIAEAVQINELNQGEDYGYAVITVSYTHLDVYKRQGYDFMDECKKLGIKVILITSENLKEKNWPWHAIDEVYYMPETEPFTLSLIHI